MFSVILMTKERSYIIYGETVHLVASVQHENLQSPVIFTTLLTRAQDKEKVEWVQAISKAIVQASSDSVFQRKF